MDYEKKYNEALERAKKELAACGSMDCDATRQIFRLFPELRESEDERIRKELLAVINDLVLPDEQKARFNAYLEKQKEPMTPEEKMNHPLYLEGFDVGRKVGQVEAEQKPVKWNDADMREARYNLISCCLDWEKGERTTLLPIVAVRARYFLEHYITPPAEWSEEDELFLNVCKNALVKYQSSDKWDANIISKWLEERLKSLRSSWKPSEKQMKALKECGECKKAIAELYEQLKAL